MVEEVIKRVEGEDWSDVHFSPGNYPAVRLRGEIVQFSDFGKLEGSRTREILTGLLEKLSPSQKEHVLSKLNSPSYMHAGFSIELLGYRFRVNASRNGEGYHIVLRRLPSEPPLLESLGFDDETLKALRWVITRREGLFLVVGATGSGKSTTLAAMINEINRTQRRHVITLEDPIEYLFESRESLVVQKELGRDFPKFSEGLHSALREDPDVILVGEIRDVDSFYICLRASETGHLVFATLHTQDALSTINRLVAMAGPGEQNLIRDRLAQVLVGVLAQKLFLGLDGKRRLAWELLVPTKGMREQIRANQIPQIKSMLDNTPMCRSFNRSIYEAVEKGLLDEERALSLAPDPGEYRKYAEIRREGGTEEKGGLRL